MAHRRWFSFATPPRASVAVLGTVALGAAVAGWMMHADRVPELRSQGTGHGLSDSHAQASPVVQQTRDLAAPPAAMRTDDRPNVFSGKERTAFGTQRERMVATQLRGRDIADSRVLDALRRVPRHLFVPSSLRDAAYEDRPLPIGHGQTISQPYIVALMTQSVRPRADARALDVGTGSGYQAAVLAELCREVYSLEILEPLAHEASQRLANLGYRNIEVRCGDGYQGWPEKGPFDVIIVAAAPDHVPQPLLDQLALGGRLVIPVGDWEQDLLLIEKQPDGRLSRRALSSVAFVPMTGKARSGRRGPD